jgi:ribosomal protein S18 acetylase RimI-like enzyme
MSQNRVGNIEVTPAFSINIPDIQAIANIAWPNAFAEILSEQQICYMMDWMYSSESLEDQIKNKEHRFFIARSDGESVGFMSIENNCGGSGHTKIHKIYIIPDQQGNGIGRTLLDSAASAAIQSGDSAIYLNVNKFNARAISFYQRYGLVKIKDEIIDIGDGFVMDDFVFEKRI